MGAGLTFECQRHSSVTQSGTGSTTGELTGWDDFTLEFSIDNPDGADKSVIEFAATKRACGCR